MCGKGDGMYLNNQHDANINHPPTIKHKKAMKEARAGAAIYEPKSDICV